MILVVERDLEGLFVLQCKIQPGTFARPFQIKETSFPAPWLAAGIFLWKKERKHYEFVHIPPCCT